jgi:hypothetical protein
MLRSPLGVFDPSQRTTDQAAKVPGQAFKAKQAVAEAAMRHRLQPCNGCLGNVGSMVIRGASFSGRGCEIDFKAAIPVESKKYRTTIFAIYGLHAGGN